MYPEPGAARRCTQVTKEQIITAIFERKRVALGVKGWNTKPWKSVRKSPRDKLLDILSEISSVLEEIDRMQSCAHVDERFLLKHDILRRCWRLDELLQSWTNIAPALKNFERHRGTGDLLGPTDPEDFALAQLTILYWATCSLVYANVVALVDKSDDLPARIDPIMFVRRVESSMPYFYHPRAGAMGPKSASFPLGLVLQVYFGMKDESPGDFDVFAGFTKAGFDATAIVNFILSMQRGYNKTGMTDLGGIQGMRSLAKAWMSLSNM